MPSPARSAQDHCEGRGKAGFKALQQKPCRDLSGTPEDAWHQAEECALSIPVHLQETLHGSSGPCLSCQRCHSRSSGPLFSKMRVTGPTAPGSHNSWFENRPGDWVTGRGQGACAAWMRDSRRGWRIARFHPHFERAVSSHPRRTACNWKRKNCLLLGIFHLLCLGQGWLPVTGTTENQSLG